LTSHLRLGLRLRMTGAITLLPLYALGTQLTLSGNFLLMTVSCLISYIQPESTQQLPENQHIYCHKTLLVITTVHISGRRNQMCDWKAFSGCLKQQASQHGPTTRSPNLYPIRSSTTTYGLPQLLALPKHSKDSQPILLTATCQVT